MLFYTVTPVINVTFNDSCTISVSNYMCLIKETFSFLMLGNVLYYMFVRHIEYNRVARHNVCSVSKKFSIQLKNFPLSQKVCFIYL